MVPAVGEVWTRPLASLVALVGDTLAVAPVEGGANVTLIPDTAFPWASTTLATSAALNATATRADWSEPETTWSAVAAPGRLVSANVTGVAMPLAAWAE